MNRLTAYRFYGGSAGVRKRSYSEGEPIPNGYFATPEEAKSQWEHDTRLRMADRNGIRYEADAKAEVIKAALGERIAELEKTYHARIYADGDAHDTSGLETFIEIVVTVQGKLGPHEFIYKYEGAQP